MSIETHYRILVAITVGILVIAALYGLGTLWLWSFAQMYKLAFYFHYLP